MVSCTNMGKKSYQPKELTPKMCYEQLNRHNPIKGD